MKRLREEDEEEERKSQKMASIRLLLSTTAGEIDKTHKNTKPTDCPFECKTCSGRFPSFQALGGHRTSHKRTRVREVHLDQTKSLKLEPKVHQCAVCGLKFPMGQALGGHMRRHKPTTQRLSQDHREKKSGVVKVLLLDLNLPPLGTELEVRPPESTLGFLGKAPTLDCLNLLN